jgi:hypothetical protein
VVSGYGVPAWCSLTGVSEGVDRSCDRVGSIGVDAYYGHEPGLLRKAVEVGGELSIATRRDRNSEGDSVKAGRRCVGVNPLSNLSRRSCRSAVGSGYSILLSGSGSRWSGSCCVTSGELSRGSEAREPQGTSGECRYLLGSTEGEGLKLYSRGERSSDCPGSALDVEGIGNETSMVSVAALVASLSPFSKLSSFAS